MRVSLCAPYASTRHTYRCELEIVFVARGTPMLPELWRFHNLQHGGCSATTYATVEHAPNNTVVMVGAGKWKTKDAVGRIETAAVETAEIAEVEWRWRLASTLRLRQDAFGSSAARFRHGLHACTRLVVG